jgi:hypothetical protein
MAVEVSVQQMALCRDTGPGGFMERVVALLSFVTSTVLTEPGSTPYHQSRAMYAQKVVERPQQMATQAAPMLVMQVNIVSTTTYHEETQTSVCTATDQQMEGQILVIWNALAAIDTPS